ncbi:MAG TPA: EutN/CcmL family microcompartment protein [Bacteroidales bacterium]|nr:EutN/CcmL family microcompartment protein [Bacteroidales bacterium]
MIIGKVIGNVVGTIKAPGYESKKILVIQPIDIEGNNKGKAILAIDAVQAGIGDIVLVLEEGNSARDIINEPESLTVKTVVAGIIDEISLNK